MELNQCGPALSSVFFITKTVINKGRDLEVDALVYRFMGQQDRTNHARNP